MEAPTKLEETINEIRLDVAKILTRLEDLKELDHEKRIKEIEEWTERQRGFHAGINWLVNFLIGVLGILIGYFLK